MRFRKLRIAWAVVCGVVCVLLVVWWVRSYWRLDVISRVGSSGATIIRVDAGLVTVSRTGDMSQFVEQGQWSLVVDGASWGMNFWQFDWARRRGIFLVRVPVWVLALAAALFAWLPWVSWSRRFSLRALLIAMALVAVMLSIVMAFE